MIICCVLLSASNAITFSCTPLNYFFHLSQNNSLNLLETMTDYLWKHVDKGGYDKDAVQSVGGVVFKSISNAIGIITADKGANYEGTKCEKVGLTNDVHEFFVCKKSSCYLKTSIFSSVNLSGNFMTYLARQHVRQWASPSGRITTRSHEGRGTRPGYVIIDLTIRQLRCHRKVR